MDQIRMFVLILVTLFFSDRGSSADTGASMSRRQHCQNRFCVTLTEAEITAETGLSVVLPCSFTTGFGFNPQNIVWYKCKPSKEGCGDSDIIFHSNKNNRNLQPGFEGRVSLLNSDLSQKNCSIIIKDLVESDSGSYQLRVIGHMFGITDGFTFSSRATISVKGPVQHCSAALPWTVAGVSLSVNVFGIIYVMFLWNTRRKVKPNQEDRTYASLQKTDQSAEYDVIAHRLN